MLSENKEKYTPSREYKGGISAHMITINVTKENSTRLHEIIREMMKLNSISKLDDELLLACCECL